MAKPSWRCSSTQSETREVQFMATTSAFSRTGAQVITLTKCWRQSTKFVKVIDSGLENTAQGQALALNRFVVLGDGEAILFRLSRMHVTWSRLDQPKSSNAVVTPGTRHTDDQIERRTQTISSTLTTLLSSCVLRASFLPQDRSDLGEAAKSLAQQM